MPIELINILATFPMLAVFIWYNERKDRMNQEFLREERQAREASLNRLADKIDCISTKLSDHDDRLERAVITMTERSKPDGRQSARKSN